MRLFAFLAAALLLFGCTEQLESGLPTPSPSTSPLISPSPQAREMPSPSTSVVSTQARNVDLKTYASPQYVISYPADWTATEFDAGMLFQSPLDGSDDAFQESVNVIITPTRLSLRSFVEEALSPTIESKGFELVGSEEFALSGNPGIKIVYSEPSDQGRLQYLQAISVANGQAAIITYTSTTGSYKSYLPQAEKMLSSFKLAQAPTTPSALPTVQAAIPPSAGSSMAPELVRKWRVYSQAIYYDSGGWNYLDTPATTLLELKADQTWSFGSSTGTWSVQPIQASDWTAWGVSSYGPKRKLVLNGWNGETNAGPIDETEARVDFMWVIYRVGPPTVSSPAQIQMKFGQTRS